MSIFDFENTMAAITTAVATTNSTTYEYSEFTNLATKDWSEVNDSAATDIEKDYSYDYKMFTWFVTVYVIAVWGSVDWALKSDFGSVMDSSALSKLRFELH